MRIFSLSITTNWAIFPAWRHHFYLRCAVQLPDHWYIDEGTLRILGIVLLLIIAVHSVLRLYKAAAYDD